MKQSKSVKPRLEAEQEGIAANAVVRPGRDRQDELGIEQDASTCGPDVRFTQSERQLIQEFGVTTLHPYVFTLVLQTACRAVGVGAGQGSWVHTDEVVCRTTRMGKGFEATIRENYRTALSLGLLARKELITDGERTSTLWSITQDGKRFLMHGLRARLAMRKFLGSDAEICELLADEDIEEWRQEALDRGANLTRSDGHDQVILRRRPNAPSVALTRAQYARTIALRHIRQVKEARTDVGPLWAGLVR